MCVYARVCVSVSVWGASGTATVLSVAGRAGEPGVIQSGTL